MAKKKVLILRTCESDMSSHGGFKWPESGRVKAPDWDPEPVCGGGLHGWLWGEGNGELGNWGDDAKWLVVKVDADKVIDLGGKVKFPAGEVVFCGNRLDATNYLAERAPSKAVIGATVVAGYRGTATAGDYGTATAGGRGTATAGDYGTAMVGDGGTATAGYGGMATAGNYGTATAGHWGRATAGDWGTAMAGDHGTATVGDGGTATAGTGGTATAGTGGTATAGEEGRLCLEYFDGNRYRIKTAYVGEDGILPNVMYKLDDDGNFR